MIEDLTPNTNYANTTIVIKVDGEYYPLLKTSAKMAFYMKDDAIKRIKIENIESVVPF